MLKYVINKLVFFILFFGYRDGLAQDPTPRPYFSIEESKKHKAFVQELRPQQPFIEIEGHKHFIKNAWIEHPHVEKNFGDKIGNDYYCFVVELEYISSSNIDLSDYIQELGNGSSRIWFFLTKEKQGKNFVKLEYHSTRKQKSKFKYFLFYK